MGHVSPRILYVDDDQDTCELMELFLRYPEKNYEVVSARSVPQAIDMIGAGRFDLYVFDYRMGDMDAPDFCNYIRETDSSTPILIFSAMPQQLYKDLAFSSGATAYLVKPNDLETLPSTVESLLAAAAPGDSPMSKLASDGKIDRT